jgi:hypothetical protein
MCELHLVQEIFDASVDEMKRSINMVWEERTKKGGGAASSRLHTIWLKGRNFLAVVKSERNAETESDHMRET